MKDNLYWAVYKNLEKELLELSFQIHIDDRQLVVYSVKIAELLLRCSVEIESIAKELYEQDGGNMTPLEDDGTPRDLFFDTDCMAYLEDRWMLGKKKVFVVASSFHLRKEENNTLTPLHKAYRRGTSGAKWKRAYMAVKHERSKKLSEGNIGNLISAMAALFLLNVYYREVKIEYDRVQGLKLFSRVDDISCGSEIFSVKCAFANFPESQIPGGARVDDGSKDEFVYLGVIDQNSYEQAVSKLNARKVRFVQNIINKIHPGISKEDIYKIINEEKLSLGDQKESLSNVTQLINNAKFEIVLNKGQKIYHTPNYPTQP